MHSATGKPAGAMCVGTKTSTGAALRVSLGLECVLHVYCGSVPGTETLDDPRASELHVDQIRTAQVWHAVTPLQALGRGVSGSALHDDDAVILQLQADESSIPVGIKALQPVSYTHLTLPTKA